MYKETRAELGTKDEARQLDMMNVTFEKFKKRGYHRLSMVVDGCFDLQGRQETREPFMTPLASLCPRERCP